MAWNPSDVPLQLKTKINDKAEVDQTIPAGGKLVFNCPVNNSDVGITYSGDRRLVILETSFK